MTVTASASALDPALLAPDSRVDEYRRDPALDPDWLHYSLDVAPAFQVRLDRASNGWLVTDQPSGIHGFGQTPLDAMNDFREAAREHLDVLEREEVLSDDLGWQLEYLRARLTH
jgi:hypothetical protein